MIGAIVTDITILNNLYEYKLRADKELAIKNKSNEVIDVLAFLTEKDAGPF